jgi:serine/threonine protein kinase/WD40 repeat protein
MSKTERWDTIERLFRAALEEAPEDRSAFLDSACQGNVPLRKLVDALLQQNDSSDSSMTRSAAELFAIALSPGTRLGPYQIVSVAGIGGMGQVYRATDSRLKRDVAIKTLPLPPYLSLDAGRLQRFEREATLLASVNHPNIGSIYDVIESDDVRFLVLEFVEGLTLNEHLEKGPLPIRDVLQIALQIAQALEASHHKGIVHRDLKPANIKITPTGHVKVLDFGLAEAFGSEPENVPNGSSVVFVAAITKLTSLRGTPAYMSPEQVRGDSLEPRTDIWAFGCVLYELLTSTKAFGAKTVSGTLDAVLNDEPDWNRVRQDVPLDLHTLLCRCLNKNAGDRPSAKELRQKIEKMLAPLPNRSSRAGIVALFGIVVIGLIALIVFLDRSDPGSPHVDQMRQVTFGPELELDPAFSPDGEMVAYSILAGDRTDIHVRRLASGDVINLTRDIPGSVHRWPRWSPDGTTIAFVTRPDDVLATSWFNRHSIQVMPASGGMPRPIGNGGRLGHTWSPDGRRLAFVRDYGIYIASLDGREPSLIGEISQVHSLAWSPDGKWIAYVSGNPEYLFSLSELGNIAASSVGVITAAGGEPRVLTDKVTSNSSPVWATDSKSILFLSNRGGSRDVFQLKLSNDGTAIGEPVRLTTGLNALTIDLSRDGKQLGYVTFARKGNLWSMPIPQQESASVSSAKRITSGSQIIEGVDASSDGQFLVFDSNLGGNQDIYRMPRKGSGPVQRLTTDPRDDFMPSWSPDGKYIAFHSFRSGNRDIFIMSEDGQNQQQITSDPAQERYAAWSPDGGSLVFFSDKTGRPEVYIITKEKDSWGKPRQLTSSKGSQFGRWSPDGKLIAYIDLTEGLKVIAPGGENSKLLVPRRPGFFPIYTRWSTDSREIYFKVNDDQDVGSIWSIPSTGGVPKRLVQFQQPDRVEFGVGSDEFFFPITERDTEMWVAKLAR